MSLSKFHPAYITPQEQGDIVIVTFTVTNLTEEENIEQMGQELFALIEQYFCRKVILSLQNVEFVASSALGKMITMHRKLHRNDGRLVICDVGQTVEAVLRTSKLIDYFNVVENVEAAVQALG